MFKNNNYTISSELKYKPDTAQLLHQVHMMSHITCPLRFLCWVHVMPFSQPSSLPSSLSSSLSICLVQVACDCHTASCQVCPLVWPVHHPVAWYKLHVISYSQLSSFHPSLFSPFFRCIVLGACYVMHPLDLFPSSVQHCAPFNLSLSQSTRLVVASCWTRKRIQFTWTFTFTFTFN